MKIKVGTVWKNGKLRYKRPNGGWLQPLRQYMKVGGVWSRFYNDPNAVVETFETGNLFTEGTLSVIRQATSAYKGGYGLYAAGTHDTLRTKLSSVVLQDLTGTYRYETMVRPVLTDWGQSLVGLAFCGATADTQDVYSAFIDTRNTANNPAVPTTTMGLQLRYGPGWNELLNATLQEINFGQWYRLVVTHNQTTGLIEVVLEDEDGVVLNKITKVDKRLKGGRFGVFTVGAGDFDLVSREKVS